MARLFPQVIEVLHQAIRACVLDRFRDLFIHIAENTVRHFLYAFALIAVNIDPIGRVHDQHCGGARNARLATSWSSYAWPPVSSCVSIPDHGGRRTDPAAILEQGRLIWPRRASLGVARHGNRFLVNGGPKP